jgi:hypothetical protein
LIGFEGTFDGHAWAGGSTLRIQWDAIAESDDMDG